MREIDAVLIDINEKCEEIRLSDGTKVWPGTSKVLSEGYWFGMKAKHVKCQSLNNARKLLRGEEIERKSPKRKTAAKTK